MQATAIKRRPRGERRSTGQKVLVKPRDLSIFKALHEHGPLSTLYLYEYAKAHSSSLASLKNRLTDLYHEDNTEHDGEYLWKPGQDYSAVTLFQHEIYDITRYAEHALEEAGHKLLPRPFESGLNPHRFMVSCTASSIEIAASEDPALSYKSRSYLLSQSPNQNLKIPASITHNGTRSDRRLIPDDLFALEYLGEKSYFRLFAVECDRGNEPYERANLDETSLHAKFLRYKYVRENGVYKEHFGRKCGLTVLFIFTTPSKMEGFIEHLLRWNNGPCDWILCKVVPSFGKKLGVPPVMRELVTTLWQRAGRAPANISKVFGW